MDVNSHIFRAQKSQSQLRERDVKQIHQQVILKMFQLGVASLITIGARLKPTDQENATDTQCCDRNQVLLALDHEFLLICIPVMRAGYLSRPDRHKFGDTWCRLHVHEYPREPHCLANRERNLRHSYPLSSRIFPDDSSSPSPPVPL